LQHLDKLEDVYLAEKRLEAGRSRTISAKKLMRRSGF
jgi:predicted DNA-binding protein